MRTSSRALSAIPALLLLSCTGCNAIELLSYKLFPDYPRMQSETLTLAGIERPVSIHLDEAGIPHIEAESEADLLFGVGFMQGRDRFFAMDTLRRVARGRISELVGEQPMLDSTTVAFDVTMRGWGFDALAARDAREVGPEMRTLLEAYVAGINAAVARQRPLEHRLLGVEPEPWTPTDSFAVGRLNAWSVSHNWSQELSRLLLALYGGAERAEQLYPSRPWPGPAAIELEGEPHPLPAAIADEVKALFPARPPVAATGEPPGQAPASAPSFAEGASNAWVIGGARTTSGKPLLAGDPHLTHFLPSLAYQQHIRSPGLEAIGMTMPGLPYVLMGHTRGVAWSMTSAVADVIDLCVEQQKPDDPSQVRTPEGWQPLQRREEVIRVLVDGALVEQRRVIRSSRNGVLLNDLYPDLLPDWAPLIAVRWDTTGTGDSLAALRASNKAGSVEELRQAVSTMVTPINTYLAADVDGTVALFSNGKMPRRRQHLGTFPIPGWLEAYQWDGFAPFEEMPFASGQGDASFAHGNTLMWDPAKSPFLYQVDSAPSYRRDRIVDLLAAKPKHDLESFAEMQRDVVLYRARRIVPHMLEDLRGLEAPSGAEREALRLLSEWRYVADTSSAACAIFWETYRQAAIAGSEDEVGPEILPFLLARRYYINALDLWYDRVDHPAWDDRRTPAQEQRPEVVRAAFRSAVASLGERLGAEPTGWRWGELHAMQPQHLMGGVSMLAGIVNLPRNEMGGGPDSIWKTHFDMKTDQAEFKTSAGPVYRMLLDLDDIEHGRWILDMGSSGWPGSPHYGDQYQRYAAGGDLPMTMAWEEIRASAQGKLELRPGG